MNKLQDKASQLVKMAQLHGLNCEVIERPMYIELKYETAPSEGAFYSFIQYSETERASVETWEMYGGKRVRVSMKALPDYFDWHAKQLKK